MTPLDRNRRQPGALARLAAISSLVAPIVSLVISIGRSLLGLYDGAGRAFGITAEALVVIGFILGISALVSAKRHGIQGVRGTALGGTCLCGLFLWAYIGSALVILSQAKR